VYAAGLASAVLAAAKQAVSIAPATDDVNVVAVRPTRNGRGVEPVYVGRFDREDVSLRHREADPLPIVFVTELVGLALGLAPESLGLQRHFVDTTAVTGGIERPAAGSEEAR
jgi:hypothetical protein